MRRFFGPMLALSSATACLFGSAMAQEAELSYGDVLAITPNLQFVTGREIDLANNEIDIANALLYKSGTTLVVIDTGGTAGFVQYLDGAAQKLRPFQKVLLISTHGHADHVGNNAWIDTLGVPATHLISAHDLAVMRDQVGYFDGFIGEIFARSVVEMFGGLNTETETMKLLEAHPLQSISLGGTSWSGWSFLDGDVLVLRTSGHTGGHVAVYLAGPGLLHLGDESTSFYQAFSDGTPAGPASNLLTLQRAASAVRSGALNLMTDGHSFRIHQPDGALELLDGLIDGALAYDAAVTRVLAENPKGISVPDLVDQVGSAPELAAVPGGAAGPYRYLQIANKLREIGIEQAVDPAARIAFPN